MTFTFPNPQFTSEFTGDNGITYAWDTVDLKWQVKSFETKKEKLVGAYRICDALKTLDQGELVFGAPWGLIDESQINYIRIHETDGSGNPLPDGIIGGHKEFSLYRNDNGTAVKVATFTTNNFYEKPGDAFYEAGIDSHKTISLEPLQYGVNYYLTAVVPPVDAEDFDPQLKEHLCAEFFTVVAAADFADAEGHVMTVTDEGSGKIKYSTKPAKHEFFVDGGNIFVDSHGPWEVELDPTATETVDFWLQGGPTPSEGGIVTFSKTLKLCETVDYLQNEIIDIEEELDAIAPSIEHGTWAFDIDAVNANTPNPARPPAVGKYFLLKGAFPNWQFTTDYQEATTAVFHYSDHNSTEHNDWTTIEPGKLINMFDRPDPDFVFGEVVQVIDHNDPNSPYGGVAAVVEFKNLKSDGSPINKPDVNGDFLTRVNIFEPPSGGVASDFVLKTGDKMSGPLTMGDTTQMADNVNTDSPEVVFKAKNSSGTVRTTTLKTKSNGTTLYASGSFTSGGSISAKGNIRYDGSDRIKLTSSSGMQELSVSSNVAMQWDSTYGIRGIRAANSWGGNGKYLAYSSSYGLEWVTPPSSTISDYVKDGTNRSGSPITITKSGGVYYITGG